MTASQVFCNENKHTKNEHYRHRNGLSVSVKLNLKIKLIKRRLQSVIAIDTISNHLSTVCNSKEQINIWLAQFGQRFYEIEQNSYFFTFEFGKKSIIQVWVGDHWMWNSSCEYTEKHCTRTEIKMQIKTFWKNSSCIDFERHFVGEKMKILHGFFQSIPGEINTLDSYTRKMELKLKCEHE